MDESRDPTHVGLQLDATGIQVLAHPLRSRLLSRLRVDGPATATELAAALHTNTGATSYHLRKLESVGLVTDTGKGEGKRRLWRAATTFHSWNSSDFRHDEDAAAAMGWLERDYIRQLGFKAEQWQDASAEWPDEWVDPLGLNDSFVVVTPEQLRELNAEHDALVERFRHLGDGDPRARRIQVYTYTHPSDLNFAGPEDEESGA